MAFFGFRILGETLEPAALAAARSGSTANGPGPASGMTLGMALIYRWAMSREPVDWRASLLGGAAGGGPLHLRVLGAGLLRRGHRRAGGHLRLGRHRGDLPDLAVVERERECSSAGAPGHRGGARGPRPPGAPRLERACAARPWPRRKLRPRPRRCSSRAGAGLGREVGHVDPGERVVGQQREPGPRRAPPPAHAAAAGYGTGQRCPRASTRISSEAMRAHTPATGANPSVVTEDAGGPRRGTARPGGTRLTRV